MAEYIDRQDLIKFLDNLQQHKIPITDGFKYITIDDAIRVVEERPIAEVLERKKIDKAIKEITELINHSKLSTVNVYNRYSEGLKDCLDILKRNIGEEVER